MKVSISWLKELVDLKIPIEEVVHLLSLRTIGIKEVTEDFIELDMKGYNRADLLSMRGVAYEIAAITDSKVNFEEPNPDTFAWVGENLPEAPVRVENKELSPLYCIAKISGLKVESSPAEWIKKLEDSGMRPVNNIADITNLVMLEYGQPSHAFDAAAVDDEVLIVRSAKEGETIVTLDGKTRQLTGADLLIADPQKPLGLAGVMGGKNSEVTDNTHTILLEVAIFDPKTIRKTAQNHNLLSEASKRFQHGLTKTRALQALDAAIKLYQEMGGNLEAVSIMDNLEEQVKTVPLTQQKINSLIGIEVKPEDIISYLEKLHFITGPSLKGQASSSSSSLSDLGVDDLSDGLRADGFQAWEVTVPYWRLDINIEEDLIEEVARMYGYEKIPPKELTGEPPEKIDQSLFDLIYKLKTELTKTGLTEIQTYSFYSTQVIENCKLKIENLVHIANPISSETEYMRDYIWPNLLEKAAENLKYFDEVAIFEIGKVYQAKPELKEEYKLAVSLVSGSSNPTLELYSIFKEAVLSCHPGIAQDLSVDSGVAIAPQNDNQVFHPTRYTNLTKDGEKVGKIAEVHSRIANKFGIDKRVAVLELRIRSNQF